MANLRLVCLMRDPFVDKVPSLVTLLSYFVAQGHNVDLVLPTDETYPPPSFAGPGLRVIHPSGRLRLGPLNVRCPFTLALVARGLGVGRSGPGPRALMGVGVFGMMAAYCVSLILRLPLICFSIELPDPPGGPFRLAGAIERFCYRRANLVIVQDPCRQRYLVEMIAVRSARIVVLPNGTLTREPVAETGALRQQLQVPSSARIVLHSGGLGRWFDSLGVARAAAGWPAPWLLAFHTSHRVAHDPYFQKVKAVADPSKVRFAGAPVGISELDGLVSGASIGLAWYSLELLGFRGELMGMAAGKIGQYLKCGLPVVCNDIASIRYFLDQYECGICVKSLDELPAAFTRIWASYDSYSQNARRCYRELWNIEENCSLVMRGVEKMF
jgi:hypothetical protein